MKPPPDGPEDGGSATTAARARRSSALIAAGILLSRISGLVRERALGHFLGTSVAADAFTAAARIPNLLQRLLGEGVLSASFIPVYSRLLEEGREDEAGRVAGAVAGLLALATGVLALVGVLFAEPLTLVVASGFRARPETLDLTVTLVRIMFPGVGFLVLSAWCLGVLNSHRRFFLSYVAPVFLNVVQIAVLVGVGLAVTGTGDDQQASLATWLAVGTVAGGLLQFLVQLPTVRKVSTELRLSVRTDLEGVRTTARSFGPVVGARGVVQLSSYVQLFLASYLAVGSLATLRYAQILYLLPISLFGMSVAAAELPELSRAGPERRRELADRVDGGLTRIAVFVVPTMLGYLLVGDLIVGAVFRTGAFGDVATVAVWVVLGGYALGLLASTSSRLLQSVLYGIGDARTPARLAILRVGVSSVLGVALMVQLDRIGVTSAGIQQMGDLPAFGPLPEEAREAAGDDLVRLGAAGLSLAGGLASWVEYVLLRRAVRRQVAATTLGGGRLRTILLACLPAGVVALAVRPLVDDLPALVAGPLAVAAVGVVYLAAGARLGLRDISDVLRGLRRRVRRT